MMQDKRRHKRFNLDLMKINGKMILAHKVEIIDISIGGIALKTDRRLNVGKEYLVTLGDKEKSIVVKGVIVRCELSTIEERCDGERVLIYAAGMMFKDVAPDKIAEFLDSIEQHKKGEVPAAVVDRRQTVRFYITTPGEQTLSFPAQFKVKEISLSGMLIQTQEALKIESKVPMGLSFTADNPVNFIGRVISCRLAGDKEQAYYVIGVEFTDLIDENRTLLKTFIDYMAVMEVNARRRKSAN